MQKSYIDRRKQWRFGCLRMKAHSLKLWRKFQNRKFLKMNKGRQIIREKNRIKIEEDLDSNKSLSSSCNCLVYMEF